MYDVKHWYICDRVRENQPYVGKNIFPVFDGFCNYIAGYTFATNLKSIARLASEIRLFLLPDNRQSDSPKRQFLLQLTRHAIFPYTCPFHVANFI